MPALDLVHLTDPADERLADYVALTDVALRSRHEPARGLYIAESSTVLGRALAAGHRPRSVLVSPRWLPDLEAMLTSRDPGDPPVRVYVAEPAVLDGCATRRGGTVNGRRVARRVGQLVRIATGS